MDFAQANTESQTGAPPGRMERAFAVLVLLLGSRAFMTLATTQGQISNQGSGVLGLEILWALIYAVTFCLLHRHCPDFLRQLFKEWPLVALAALAVVSTAWSDDPGITFRRSVALCLTILFGFYLAKRFSLREQLHLLAWVCGISVFFSLLFGLLQSGAVMPYNFGAWHGIFVLKNELGRMMALSVLVFLLLGKVEPERRWRMRLAILAALVLLVLSRSATALVVTALVFVLFPLSGILRKRFGKALAGMTLVTIGGMAAIIWVSTHFEAFTGALGKNATLSGRLQLWALSVVMALQKPWLGYGYSAFWLGLKGQSARLWRALGWQIPHAHNGFIQIWLDLGLAGVALLLLIFAVYVIRAGLLVRRTTRPEAVWPLMVLMFSFLYILTEVTIPAPNSIFMMVFSSSVFAVSAPLRETSAKSPEQEFAHAGTATARPSFGSTSGSASPA
jgi:exopolysaccharide production protein ExoQ